MSHKNEQTDISYHCVSGGGSVGHYICLYQIVADGRTDSSTDIRVALYHSIRNAAGVFVDAQAFPMVLEGVAGRAADGGTGHYGRFVVFPDRELGDDLHDHDKHVADSMYVSAICRTFGVAILSRPASARTANSGNGDVGDWCGSGGAERSFCFTPFTLGRYAGLCGLSVLGGVFAANDTCRYALRHRIYYAQGILLRTAVNDSILHGLSGPALAQLGVPYRCATEPAFPRLRGLDVMFLGMELGCKEVGGDSGHELCVFQPRDHGAVCLAYLVGAYHGVFPDGYGAHSDGFVFL